MEDDKVRNILEKRANYRQGTKVTNCVSHMHTSILERSMDCTLCNTDVKNTLQRAMSANAFMNDLFDELRDSKASPIEKKIYSQQ